jgi:hypothetical protein
VALRDAIDHGSKVEFEKTFDGCRQLHQLYRRRATISSSSNRPKRRCWTTCASRRREK